MSRRKERKRRWEAEQERQHAGSSSLAAEVAVRRLFWYSGGLAQQDLDEPEPRVLRWDEVDSFTPLIYDDSGCVAGGRLRGRTGTEITVSLGYGLRYLVGEADGTLADRLVPELVGAYDAGEPIAAGHWWIGQAGLTRVHADGREALTPWRDIRHVHRPADRVRRGAERHSGDPVRPGTGRRRIPG